MMARTGECRRHAGALLELFHDPLGGRLEEDARRHLDSCRGCQAEYGSLVLTGRRLQRAFADARSAEPPAGSWIRLSDRVQRRPPNLGRAASPVIGLALGASLAIALLLPLGAIRVGQAHATQPTVIHEAGLDTAAIVAAGRRDAEDEARGLRATLLARKEASSVQTVNRARAELIRWEVAPEPVRHRSPVRTLASSVQ